MWCKTYTPTYIGRYTNKDRQQRICTLCNMGMIEDPYPFLLVCIKYRELRHTFLKSYYCKWPSIQKCNTLMSPNSITTINRLARFIYQAVKQRD